MFLPKSLLSRFAVAPAFLAISLFSATASAQDVTDDLGLPVDPIAPIGASDVPAEFDTPLNATRAAGGFNAEPVAATQPRRPGVFSSLGFGRNRTGSNTEAEVRGTFENPLPSNRAEVVVEQVIAPTEEPGNRSATLVPAPGVNSVQSANRRVNFPRDPGDDIDVLKLQIFLDYYGFSVAEIDGRWGYNTERALHFYQGVNSLPQTGQIEDSIIARLNEFQAGYLIEYIITGADVNGGYFTIPRNYKDQGKMKKLPYESAAEALGERFHSAPNLLKKLNPGVDFDSLQPGTVIVAPNVANGVDDTRGSVAKVRVSKSQKILTAHDSSGGLLFYFPCTLGSKYDPLTIGNFKVNGVVFNPHFTYKPWLFWDADKNEPPVNIPPGPNSPVGRVWIATSKTSVGIHGTPNPENISKNTSAGCIRLTNWDAVQLARRVRAGTPLEFIP